MKAKKKKKNRQKNQPTIYINGFSEKHDKFKTNNNNIDFILQEKKNHTKNAKNIYEIVND